MILSQWKHRGNRRRLVHPDEMLKAIDTALKEAPAENRSVQQVAEMARRHIAVPIAALKVFIRSLSEDQRLERGIVVERRSRKHA